MRVVNKESVPPQNDVQAAPTAVPPMRSTNRGNTRRVPRRGKPVIDRRADSAALYRRVADTVMTRDQKNNPLTGPDGLSQASVDRAPGSIEIHPVQVDDPVGFEVAPAEPSIPAPVQRLS